MEALENILTRRSVRVYQDKPISKELLDEIIATAQMAPSWKHTQTPNYIVILSPEKKAELMEALPSFNARNVSTAPAVIVMTSKKGRCGYERDGSFTTQKEDRWEMFDGGIACQTLCLAAWDKGLGTCIMGIYDEDKVPALLEVPEDQYVTAIISIGYPAEEPQAPKRKPLEEKVRYYL